MQEAPPGATAGGAAAAENILLAKSTPPPRATVAAMTETSKTTGCMVNNSAAWTGGPGGSVDGPEALRGSKGLAGDASGAGADESLAEGLRVGVARAEQAARLVFPANDLCLPGQGAQAPLLGALIYVPGGHSWQLVLPDTILYVPASQGTHPPPSAPEEPGMAFSGHCWHAVAAGGAYCPGRQAAQRAGPGPGLDVPAPQGTHSLSSTPENPGMHWQALRSVLAGAELAFAGHC